MGQWYTANTVRKQPHADNPQIWIHLTNKTQTPDRNIKDKQRVNCNAHPVLQHARAAQDAHSGGQRPRNEDQVHGDAGDGGQVEGAEEGGNDKGEEGVADDADGLEEGAADDVSMSVQYQRVKRTYSHQAV